MCAIMHVLLTAVSGVFCVVCECVSACVYMHVCVFLCVAVRVCVEGGGDDVARPFLWIEDGGSSVSK